MRHMLHLHFQFLNNDEKSNFQHVRNFHFVFQEQKHEQHYLEKVPIYLKQISHASLYMEKIVIREILEYFLHFLKLSEMSDSRLIWLVM